MIDQLQVNCAFYLFSEQREDIIDSSLLYVDHILTPRTNQCRIFKMLTQLTGALLKKTPRGGLLYQVCSQKEEESIISQ